MALIVNHEMKVSVSLDDGRSIEIDEEEFCVVWAFCGGDFDRFRNLLKFLAELGRESRNA